MKKTVTALMATIMLAGGCANAPQEANEPIIGKKPIQVENGQFTPEIMHMLGKVSDPQLSPDRSRILYGVKYTSIEANKSNRELFVINVDGTGNTQITKSAKGEQNARWISDSRIMFIRGGQIWTANADGTAEKQVSDVETGVTGFELSPDGKMLMYSTDIKGCTVPTDKYADLDKTTGRMMDDLMYRSWDHYVETIPHTFVANFDGNTVSGAKDMLEGTMYMLPILPFGGMEQLSWSPDGKYIAYSCKKLVGKEFAFSTNTDIYLYEVATGKTVANLSEGNMGYDTDPIFSPDGSKLVWASMERDGYEADQRRIMVYDMNTKVRKNYFEDFIYTEESMAWREDSKAIYFSCCIDALTAMLELDLESGEIRRITPKDAMYDFTCTQVAGDKLYGTFTTMKRPAELVAVNVKDGQYTQISHENDETLAQLKDIDIKGEWVPTTDGKQMWVWFVLPPEFDSTKTYPALEIFLGGPQGKISMGWSDRWNYRLMASNGYVVVLPNRRGVIGFGQEWTEQISKDYCGQNIDDYLSAAHYAKAKPFIGKIGGTGASYGGFSTYYMAGVHNNTFSAFLAHAGIFNQEQMYMMTEELWFPTWDNGGAPWDNNPIASRHYSHSAHKLLKNWNTPIYITHGEMDYRVPVEQGMAAFNAAQMMGVESKMLLFPEENHWILRPQNSVLWNREFFAWFDKHLKK